MTQYETFKRDNLLVDFLFEHKGIQNIVSAKAICEFLNERGYHASLGSIHQIIRRVMFERRLPICSVNSKGYYWATSKEEIQMSIDDLQGRIEEMQNRIEHLKSFIIN